MIGKKIMLPVFNYANIIRNQIRDGNLTGDVNFTQRAITRGNSDEYDDVSEPSVEE